MLVTPASSATFGATFHGSIAILPAQSYPVLSCTAAMPRHLCTPEVGTNVGKPTQLPS